MSDKSKIEWTNSTWNPVTGCDKVSQGCKNCYAEREWPRLAAPRPKPNAYTGRAFTDVQSHPERLNQPLHWTKPRMIFVNSMSDLFHKDVPDEFIGSIFGVIAAAHWHIFQILTKRPERMFEWSRSVMHYPNGDQSQAPIHGWPPNAWLGISCEDQATADERIPLLLQTPAAVRWISAEPLLGPINLVRLWLKKPEDDNDPGLVYDTLRGHMPGPDDIGLPKLNWVVAGGESGPYARPSHPDWFRSLRDQCQAASVPFFFKQWGEWAAGSDYTGHDRIMLNDGTVFSDPSECSHDQHGRWASLDPHMISRRGKKAAGRLLDGLTWDEYPA